MYFIYVITYISVSYKAKSISRIIVIHMYVLSIAVVPHYTNTGPSCLRNAKYVCNSESDPTKKRLPSLIPIIVANTRSFQVLWIWPKWKTGNWPI